MPKYQEERMTYSSAIDIARVTLLIRSHCPLIVDHSAPAYQTFFRKSHDGPPDVEAWVIPAEEGAPLPPEPKILFDSGKSWMMCADADDYLIIFNSGGARAEPLWRARMSRDCSRVTVYCGKELLREKSGVTRVVNPVSYPLDQILIMYALARRRGAILHAAGILVNGNGFIFPGRSGTGKSTISQQCTGYPGISILSDDRVVVRECDDALRVFGTPWPGDAGIALNAHAPLRAMFFIRHGDATAIRGIGAAQALELLLPAASVPWYDRETLQPILTFLEDLVNRVPAYELRFKPNAEVVDVLAEFGSA
jgi:hypothetical protein